MFFSMFLSVFVLFGIGLRNQLKGQEPLYSVRKDFFCDFIVHIKKKPYLCGKNGQY